MTPKVVLPIFGGHLPDPDWGGLGDAGWARGATFLEHVGSGADRADVEAAFRDLAVEAEIVAFLSAWTARVRILALESSPPRTLHVAWAERLCTHSSNLWMRIFAADANADLVQRYAPDTERLPCFIFFAADRREFARLGPDPATSRGWVHAFRDCLAHPGSGC